MVKRPPLLIFDVESVGLHGEGFAWGAVLIQNGDATGEQLCWCPPEKARGADQLNDLAWAHQNVMAHITGRGVALRNPQEVRREFWVLWRWAADLGAQLMADVCWPVEANFLSSCIRDDWPAREWLGPYPLLDAGTLTVAGLTTEYAPTEPHNPLEDARATWLSIRDWWRGTA